MLLNIDFESSEPIYMQMRNQIVVAIASGELAPGERLPTIRSLANEMGVNVMTVNKAYAILKQEGYINAGRRNGAVVSGNIDSGKAAARQKDVLKLAVSELKLQGVSLDEIIKMCSDFYIKGGEE